MEQYSYPYKRLPLSRNGHQFIRILLLHPAPNLPDQLEATIVDECLCQSNDNYEAVSYAWGTEDAIHTIIIGGHKHSIRPNLFDGLRRFRPPNGQRPRRLWIDALCIDQFDNRERSQQVSLMRSIYYNAAHVIAWLGEDDALKSAEIGFRFLNYCYNCRTPDSSLPIEQVIPKIIAEYQKQHTLLDGIERSSDLERQSLVKIFRRRWFHRRWVIQEVAASKRVILMCGQFSVDWKAAQMFAYAGAVIFDEKTESHALTVLKLRDEQFSKSETLCTAAYTGKPRGKDRSFVWRYFHADSVSPADLVEQRTLGAGDILTLLNSFHDHECEDGRDRIAALAGLQDSILFTVDYQATVEDNFVAFASIVAQRGGALQLMRSSMHRWEYGKQRVLPSWVPDWRLKMRHDYTWDSWAAMPRASRMPNVRLDGSKLMLPTSAVRPLSMLEFEYVEKFCSAALSGPDQTTAREQLLCIHFYQFHRDRGSTKGQQSLVLILQKGTSRTYELLLEIPPITRTYDRERETPANEELPTTTGAPSRPPANRSSSRDVLDPHSFIYID